jgi:hypothetical protein
MSQVTQSKRRFSSAIIALPLLCLTGCGSITAQVLTADGRSPDGAPGFRYYLPRPYLLVMALPADTTTGTDSNAPQSSTVHAPPPPPLNPNPGSNPPPPPPPAKPHAGAPPPPTPSPPPAKQANAPSDQSTPATAPTSDVSYIAQNTRYVAKLVYQQDFNHPATMEFHAGLFGITNFSPTLVDGWMLTGFQGQVDNSKNADVATALLTALTSAAGPAGAGAKVAQGAPKAGGPAVVTTTPPSLAVLPPGYYGFETNPRTGLLSMCTSTLFSPTSVSPIPNCTTVPKPALPPPA